LRQKLIEAVSPAANLRQRLIFPLVAKLSRPGTDHLPYDFPGYAQLPTDRFDGLALLKKRAADLCNRLHDQHPNLGFLESWKPVRSICSGVPIGSRSPRKGGPFCMPIHNNGSCYLSKAFARACKQLAVKHIRIKPYTPQPTAKPNASSRPR